MRDGGRRDAEAPAVFALDQRRRGQAVECFAQRRRADAVALDHGIERQSLAGQQRARDDVVAQRS